MIDQDCDHSVRDSDDKILFPLEWVGRIMAAELGLEVVYVGTDGVIRDESGQLLGSVHNGK